jgi:threonine aldolase
VSYVSSDQTLRNSCTRFLSYHHPRNTRQWLLELAEDATLPDEMDFYGTGGCLDAIESEFAALLGKPAAVFMTSGTSAQQAALRVWADLSGRRAVAIHPQAHIHRDELAAYERLHGLTGVPLTHEPRYPQATDFQALLEPVGTLCVELPLRRLTYALPEWNELVALIDAARATGAHIHLDGARLLECCPYYGRTPAEIAALADSVYVSVYKGLGGIAGAVLAGPVPFVAASKVWQHRHGARLHSVFPLAMAAIAGLKRHSSRIPEYVARARELALALRDVPSLTAIPEAPHTNAFQLHFHGMSAAVLQKTHAGQAAATGSWLFNWFQSSPIPGATFADVVVGDAFDRWSVAEAAFAIRDLAQRSHGA